MADLYLLEGSGSYLLEDGSGSYGLEMSSTNGGYLTGARATWIGGEAVVLAPGTSDFLNSPSAPDFSWLYADGTGAALSAPVPSGAGNTVTYGGAVLTYGGVPVTYGVAP